MGNVIYNPENKKILDSMLLCLPLVTPGKMFGYPAYYINKKMFACLYEEGVGIKIPAETVREIIGKKGFVAFQPLGRAVMKEWVQINHEFPEDYLKDIDLFKTSRNFVDSTLKKC